MLTSTELREPTVASLAAVAAAAFDAGDHPALTAAMQLTPRNPRVESIVAGSLPGLWDSSSLMANSPLRLMGVRAASAVHRVPNIDEGGEERGKSRD
jgi:hypothetical protein